MFLFVILHFNRYAPATAFFFVRIAKAYHFSFSGCPVQIVKQGLLTDKDLSALAFTRADLPQTGNNSMKNWLIVFGAFMLIGLGVVSVKTSSVSFRRKDEQYGASAFLRLFKS